MPVAYGDDRILAVNGDRYVLLSRADKGWIPRARRTAGTTVEWDGALYEAVEATPHPAGVRYVLEPWDERHVMRHTSTYDAASESARAVVRAATRRDEKFSIAIVLGSFFVGQLPAVMQRRIEERFGISAGRLTVFSTIPYFIFGAYCASRVPIPKIDEFTGAARLPGPVVALGLFFFIESVVRLRYALANGPIGSIIGTILSLPALPFVRPDKGKRVPVRGPADPSVALADAWSLREPVAALLPAADQLQLQKRFLFDPILWGKRTAATLLIVAGLGAFVEFATLASGFGSAGSVVSGLAAIAVAAEQIYRFQTLNSGRPAPSIFGYVVRGLFTKLLAR